LLETLSEHVPETLENYLIFSYGYVNNRDFSQPTGRHFNSRGHSISDMSVVIVEKVFSEDRLLREERESDFIRLFNSRAKGLNIDT